MTKALSILIVVAGWIFAAIMIGVSARTESRDQILGDIGMLVIGTLIVVAFLWKVVLFPPAPAEIVPMTWTRWLAMLFGIVAVIAAALVLSVFYPDLTTGFIPLYLGMMYALYRLFKDLPVESPASIQSHPIPVIKPSGMTDVAETIARELGKK